MLDNRRKTRTELKETDLQSALEQIHVVLTRPLSIGPNGAKSLPNMPAVNC